MLGATILPVPRRIYIAVQIAGYIGSEERFTDLNEIVSQTMYKDISSSIHTYSFSLNFVHTFCSHCEKLEFLVVCVFCFLQPGK